MLGISKKLETCSGILLVLIVGLFTLTPIIFVVTGSFDVSKPGQPFSFGLDGWREALVGSPRTLAAIGYTFLLSVRAPIAALIGFLFAWLLCRVEVPGRKLIEFGLWVAFFLPPLSVALGWVLLADPHYGLINEAFRRVTGLGGSILNIHSVAGILWVHLTTSSIPIMAILLIPALRQFDGALEESALVSGASHSAILRAITLPILAPAVLTALLAGFIRSLEAFEVEQLLGTPAGIMVYSTRVYDYIHWEPALFPPAMALSTFFLVILLSGAIFYQRYTVRRHFATVTGKRVRSGRIAARPLRYLGSAVCFFFLFVSVVVPLTMVVAGSFMFRFGFFTIDRPFSAVHWFRVFSDPEFLGSLLTSIEVGLIVATLGIGFYGLLAYTLLRTRIWGRSVVSVLVWLPWAVPGVLLGMGFLWLILSLPGLNLLHGTVLGLALALIIKDMPVGVQMLKAALGQVSEEMEEASTASGAGRLGTFRRILVPLVAPMLVNIYVLIFMSSIRDISTTILLASPSARPLSVLMMESASSGNMEGAVVIGTMLSALALSVAIGLRKHGLGLASEGV